MTPTAPLSDRVETPQTDEDVASSCFDVFSALAAPATPRRVGASLPQALMAESARELEAERQRLSDLSSASERQARELREQMQRQNERNAQALDDVRNQFLSETADIKAAHQARVAALEEQIAAHGEPRRQCVRTPCVDDPRSSLARRTGHRSD